MKVRSANEIYRNPGIDPAVNHPNRRQIVMKNTGETLAAIQSGRINIDGDTLELSDEVKGALQEAFDQAMKKNEQINEMNAAMHDAVWAEQTGDAMKADMEDRMKAMEIARLIGRGGKVPPQDEAFLLKSNPDMYKLAKLQALMAEEEKKHDSVLEEREKKEYDWDKGQDDTRHRVALDVIVGDAGVEIAGVSEVAVGSGDLELG